MFRTIVDAFAGKRNRQKGQGPMGRRGSAQVAVVTIIDEEFEAARDALAIDQELAGTQYFIRKDDAKDALTVVLTQALDRSNIPCNALVANLIDDLRPHVLLLVGVAGGLTSNGTGRDGIRLGDVLIADYVSYVDFLKITAEKIEVRHYALDHPSLHLRASVALPISKRFAFPASFTDQPEGQAIPKVLIGEIVSGDKVMGGVDNNMQQDLLRPYDKALAVDMESIGMARSVCERRSSVWYNPRYAVIRGISDLVGVHGNNETRSLWKGYAARAAAVVASEFIRRLPLAETLSGSQGVQDRRQE
jgi:nucleoside phosphorylase